MTKYEMLADIYDNVEKALKAYREKVKQYEKEETDENKEED